MGNNIYTPEVDSFVNQWMPKTTTNLNAIPGIDQSQISYSGGMPTIKNSAFDIAGKNSTGLYTTPNSSNWWNDLTSSDKIDLGLGGMQLGLGLANYFSARDQQKLNEKIAEENRANTKEQAALQKMTLGDMYAVAGSMSQGLGAKDNPYKDQIERLRSGERLV